MYINIDFGEERLLFPKDVLRRDKQQVDDRFFQNVHSQKCLASIDDQISQPFSGADEFSDNDAYETQADIYLHDT